MKIVLIVVCTLAVLGFATLLIGYLLPREHTAIRSATYRDPPEHLFALIIGPQGWRPGIARSEAVTGADGRRLVRETDVHGETISYEIVDLAPPRSVTRRIVTPNLPYSGSWSITLEPRNGSTVVRITENGAVSNPLFRFLSRFVFGYTRTIDEYLVALGKASGDNVNPQD